MNTRQYLEEEETAQVLAEMAWKSEASRWRMTDKSDMKESVDTNPRYRAAKDSLTSKKCIQEVLSSPHNIFADSDSEERMHSSGSDHSQESPELPRRETPGTFAPLSSFYNSLDEQRMLPDDSRETSGRLSRVSDWGKTTPLPPDCPAAVPATDVPDGDISLTPNKEGSMLFDIPNQISCQHKEKDSPVKNETEAAGQVKTSLTSQPCSAKRKCPGQSSKIRKIQLLKIQPDGSYIIFDEQNGQDKAGMVSFIQKGKDIKSEIYNPNDMLNMTTRSLSPKTNSTLSCIANSLLSGSLDSVMMQDLLDTEAAKHDNAEFINVDSLPPDSGHMTSHMTDMDGEILHRDMERVSVSSWQNHIKDKYSSEKFLLNNHGRFHIGDKLQDNDTFSQRMIIDGGTSTILLNPPLSTSVVATHTNTQNVQTMSDNFFSTQTFQTVAAEEVPPFLQSLQPGPIIPGFFKSPHPQMTSTPKQVALLFAPGPAPQYTHGYSSTPHPILTGHTVEPLGCDKTSHPTINNDSSFCQTPESELDLAVERRGEENQWSGTRHTPASLNLSYRQPVVPNNTPYNRTKPTNKTPLPRDIHDALYMSPGENSFNRPILGKLDLHIRSKHNAKERARRARVKIACDLLREVVPGMTPRTDKATVFEYAYEYIKYLKRFAKRDHEKDFLLKTIPADLEESVVTQ